MKTKEDALLTIYTRHTGTLLMLNAICLSVMMVLLLQNHWLMLGESWILAVRLVYMAAAAAVVI